jgi:hypothetical protein
MNAELADLALRFLARVDLKGAEAPALMQVVAALEQFTKYKGNGADVYAEPRQGGIEGTAGSTA